MNAWFLLAPILIPIIGGLSLRFLALTSKIRKLLTMIIVVITAGLAISAVFLINDEVATIIKFGKFFSFALKIDGPGKIFSVMVSVLWPFATLYSFAYMADEKRQEVYNAYYTITYGIVLGIAYSANLMSMYVFYEFLTFITLPLITHPATKEARKAGRTYLYFSLTGSSVALVGMGMLVVTVGSLDFIPGGSATTAMQFAYVLSFLGFGVKAAIFPLCYWLPAAYVAPTPTTALLHAVAVVKAGAFAVIRITYYNFNINLLRGTVAQAIVLGIAAFTIIYGSMKAVREQHFKRRFAWSTIANLSYILVGIALMTRDGLVGAMMHFVYHSITKICIFFAVGAIIKNSGAHYVYEIDGLGRKMPITFAFFTVAALSLTGVPLFAGFVSKWYLCTAIVEASTPLGYVGMAALIISSILTAIYALSVPIRAYVNKPHMVNQTIYDNAHEPNVMYLISVGVFAVACILFGVMSQPIYFAITTVLGGLV